MHFSILITIVAFFLCSWSWLSSFFIFMIVFITFSCAHIPPCVLNHFCRFLLCTPPPLLMFTIMFISFSCVIMFVPSPNFYLLFMGWWCVTTLLQYDPWIFVKQIPWLKSQSNELKRMLDNEEKQSKLEKYLCFTI